MLRRIECSWRQKQTPFWCVQELLLGFKSENQLPWHVNEPIENINANCYIIWIFLGLNEFCTACECFNPKTDKWKTKKCIKKKNKGQCSKKKVKENCMKTCFDQDVLIWAEVKYIFFTMRKSLLNKCHLVSISKNVVFYVFLVVRIY